MSKVQEEITAANKYLEDSYPTKEKCMKYESEAGNHMRSGKVKDRQRLTWLTMES
jgi:hypothetical protein